MDTRLPNTPQVRAFLTERRLIKSAIARCESNANRARVASVARQHKETKAEWEARLKDVNRHTKTLAAA